MTAIAEPPVPLHELTAAWQGSAIARAGIHHVPDPQPCACGTDVVVAPRETVPAAVYRHNRTPAHRAWRRAAEGA